MKVKVVMKSSSIRVFQLKCQLMKIGYFWKYIFIQFIELPIQIFSAETSSEITCNNSIRIEHRNQIKDKLFSESDSCWIIRYQEGDQTFDDI